MPDNLSTAEPPKTVLMVSYAYPPVGFFMGSLRVVKLAKYLPQFGWKPLVLAADGGFARGPSPQPSDMPAIEVIRARDPLGSLAHATGIAGAKKAKDAAAVKTQISQVAALDAANVPANDSGAGFRAYLRSQTQKLKYWCFNSLKETLIPDYTVPWYPFAVKRGKQILRSRTIDAIYSTSPNIINHLVARRLAREFDLPWLADFRDPWTTGPVYQFGRWRHGIDRRIETRILRDATHIVTVSEGWKEQLMQVCPAIDEKTTVIPNGFDQEDLAEFRTAPRSDRFVLGYCGEFYAGKRDPKGLLQALANLKSSGRIHSENFSFMIIGRTEPEIVRYVRDLNLSDLIEFTGYLPQREALRRMAEVTYGLVITMPMECCRGEMTTKFYECIGLQRPVLALTPTNFELSRTVMELGFGQCFPHAAVEHIENWLLSELNHFESKGPQPSLDRSVTTRFSRSQIASQMAGRLDTLLPRPSVPA